MARPPRISLEEYRQLAREGRVPIVKEFFDEPTQPKFAHPRAGKSSGGKRPDLDGRYFRSKLEANTARYLNALHIRWEYETRRFEFPVKRGITFYIPDFFLPDTHEYWECKGWMDSASKTKLNRFRKYYPEEAKRLLIVTAQYFNDRSRKDFIQLIPGWEN